MRVGNKNIFAGQPPRARSCWWGHLQRRASCPTKCKKQSRPPSTLCPRIFTFAVVSPWDKGSGVSRCRQAGLRARIAAKCSDTKAYVHDLQGTVKTGNVKRKPDCALTHLPLSVWPVIPVKHSTGSHCSIYIYIYTSARARILIVKKWWWSSCQTSTCISCNRKNQVYHHSEISESISGIDMSCSKRLKEWARLTKAKASKSSVLKKSSRLQANGTTGINLINLI